MPSLTESISAINSAVRTLIAVVTLGAVGAGGWYGYRHYTEGEREAEQAAQALADAQDQLRQQTVLIEEKEAVIQEKEAAISTLNEQVKRQEEEILRLDTALRLLKVDHRVARISVLDQTTDSETGQLTTLLQFQELDDHGKPVEEPRQYRIKGDLVYVDSWVVKFDDKYVEQADIDRSTSLVLFRRIFGEFQEPKDGYTLDQVGARPTIYGRGGKMSDFEKQIWDDFWQVANDETRQEQLGIRAAHGDAPSIKVQKGKAYRVELRASDGLSITPDGGTVVPVRPAA